MTGLVYGQSDAVCLWAAKMLRIPKIDPCIGIGYEIDGFLVAACVYNNYHTDHKNQPLSIEISLACVDKTVMTRHNIKSVFAYPFIQLRVKRVQATIARRNKPVRRFVERLGFTFEGIAREGWRQGGDAAVYSMLHNECKWIDK